MYIILLMPEHKKRTHAQTSLFFAAQTSWASSWCVMDAVHVVAATCPKRRGSHLILARPRSALARRPANQR
jgi:hypothetical protein